MTMKALRLSLGAGEQLAQAARNQTYSTLEAPERLWTASVALMEPNVYLFP